MCCAILNDNSHIEEGSLGFQSSALMAFCCHHLRLPDDKCRAGGKANSLVSLSGRFLPEASALTPLIRFMELQANELLHALPVLHLSGAVGVILT